jgi:hypothetical protein
MTRKPIGLSVPYRQRDRKSMREAFEFWHAKNYPQPLDPYNNTYANAHVRCRWVGWQAAFNYLKDHREKKEQVQT